MAGRPHNRSDYDARGPKPTGRVRAEWATGSPQKHHEDRKVQWAILAE